MVRILVQNAGGRRLSYDVNLDDPIQVLKADIEETEGIPIDEQTLQYGPDGPDGLLLLLNETQTFETYNIKEDSTIFLNLPRFQVFIKTLTGKTIALSVSPEYTCSKLKEIIKDCEGIPSDQQRLVLGSKIPPGPDQRRVVAPGQMLEDNVTLMAYGIPSKATIHLVLRLTGGGVPQKAHAWVLCDWNGNMRDEGIHGLPLERGKMVYIDDLVHRNWFCGSVEQYGKRGLFPRNFVSIFRILGDDFRAELGDEPLPLLNEASSSQPGFRSAEPEDKPASIFTKAWNALRRVVQWHVIDSDSYIRRLPDDSEIPKLDLPDFPYPKTSPQFFTVKLGDKGLSFVEVAVTIKPLSTPAERPQVEVLLKCCPAHPRRISSVVISLTFRGNEVDNIRPTVELGPETKTEIEKTDNTSKSLSGGLNRQGVTINAEWKHEVEEVQSATRSTRMKISGLIKGADTALWSLTEDTGQGGKGGLPDRVPMSFTLSYKPAKVAYECRVTSVKGGSEKERYADETRAFY